MTEPYDVVVIGGGPAGSTVGTLLAEEGFSVLILEKEKFPRYRVGESLIPFCGPTLQRLGVIKKLLRQKFMKKFSVQFVSPRGRVSQPFYFHEHIKNHFARTWQVERGRFDQMLADNAVSKGAEFIEEIQVRELLWEGDRVTGVKARDKNGEMREYSAKMVVDASGRDAFSVRKQGWREADPVLAKIAIWTYYQGAKRDAGLDEGATTVAYIPEKGWFWYLPLRDDRVSVGIVADKGYLYREGRDPEAIFQREIQENQWIKDHLEAGSQTGPFRVTGDYSYRSRYCGADGLLLVGDAFSFLDPVFSSGVFLALKGGELAADAISASLKQGQPRAEQFEAYGRALGVGLEAMRRLVYAFYDQNFSFGHVLKKYPHLRADITDCLIGNVDRNFDELWSAVAEFAELPESPEYGALCKARQ